MNAAGPGGPKVAIVGAGIAGLACATALTRAGADVTVFESEPAVGGRMTTRRWRGFSFDCGATFLADCYDTVAELARDAGARIESVGDVRHVVVHGGRLCRLNLSSFGDILRFGGLSAWTKARALAFGAWARAHYGVLDFFDLSALPPELARENAYDYACRHVTPEFADYVVDPFTSTMMFHRARDIAAGAFVALFTMMASGRFSFGVRRVVGGMIAVPDALAHGLDVRRGHPAIAVAPDGGGAVLVDRDGFGLYDAVVLACPAPAARRLLVSATREQAELLEGTDYSATIEVSFQLPVSVLAGLHCVYVPYRESELVAEFTNEAIKGPDATHDGRTLVAVGLHEAAARKLMDQPDEHIHRLVGWELARLHPGIAAAGPLVVPHDLRRWPHAIPRYSPAHLARVARFWKTGQGQGHIWFCGDAMNAPWVEGAARSGARVAALVARSLGRGALRRAA